MKNFNDIFSGHHFFTRLALLVGICASLIAIYISRVVKTEINFNFSSELNKLAYDLQNHTVTTSDGYILTHHRIVPRNRDTGGQNVVMLVHGMLGKSSQWICMGPKYSLAYNLLEEGYDTWLLNLRGNSISDQHQNITSSSDYWQYTWDDIGKYDLPASIDYILQVTGKTSLHYVAHSMGASILFVLLSDRPEYTVKINKMVALGPAVYDVNVLNSYPSIYYLNKLLTDISELTNIRPAAKFGDYTCNNGWDVYCALLMTDRFEKYDPNINQTNLDELMHLSMGTGSMLLVSQFYQNFKAGKFMKYDYGRSTNLQVYGQEMPEEYNLGAVRVPVAVFYAKDDQTCSAKGIERLISKLPNIEMTEKIFTKRFSHGSYFMSESAKELINDKLIKYLAAAPRQRSMSIDIS